jgi:hypothetical protein
MGSNASPWRIWSPEEKIMATTRTKKSLPVRSRRKKTPVKPETEAKAPGGMPKKRLFYMVGRLTKTADTIMGKIKISWAEGMIGACPVFDTLEAAEKYADGLTIYRLTQDQDEEVPCK